MKLYLVRHGNALPIEVDAQQSLNPLGQEVISNLGVYLNAVNIQVKSIYHSQQKRAQQTAQLLKANLMFPEQALQILSELDPNGSVDAVYEKICSWTEDTLLVTHLPLLDRLLAKLLEINEIHPIVRWHPGTMACLTRQMGNHWIISWVWMPDLMIESYHD